MNSVRKIESSQCWEVINEKGERQAGDITSKDIANKMASFLNDLDERTQRIEVLSKIKLMIEKAEEELTEYPFTPTKAELENLNRARDFLLYLKLSVKEMLMICAMLVRTCCYPKGRDTYSLVEEEKRFGEVFKNIRTFFMHLR